MATIAVYVDLRDDVPTRPTRFALAQARRLSTALGATVHAVVGTPSEAPDVADRLAEMLGAAGADRVIVCRDPVFGGPALPSIQGRLTELVANRLRPRLLLFPSGSVGLALGAWAAARLGAPLCSRAQLIPDSDDPQAFVLVQTDGASGRRLPVGSGQPQLLVAVLAAGDDSGSLPGALRGPAAELDELAYPTTVGNVVEELEDKPDDSRDVELASTLVIVAGTVEPSELAGLMAALPPGAVAVHGPAWPSGLQWAAPRRVLVLWSGDPTGAPPVLTVPANSRVAYLGPKKLPAGWPVPHLHWKSDLATGVPALTAALLGRATMGATS